MCFKCLLWLCVIAYGYKWIRSEFRDRQRGAFFFCCCCFLFQPTAFHRVRLFEVPGERERGKRMGGGSILWIDTSRLRRTGPAVAFCMVESIDGERGRRSLLETSLSRCCCSRQWEGGKRLGEESKSLCLYFHPSLWASLCRAATEYEAKQPLFFDMYQRWSTECVNGEHLGHYRPNKFALCVRKCQPSIYYPVMKTDGGGVSVNNKSTSITGWL